MFRTALLRTSSRVAVAARPVALRSYSRVAATSVRPAQTGRIASLVSRTSSGIAVRSYSAAAGLKKEEVEGRIVGILQGFDKVRLWISCRFHVEMAVQRLKGGPLGGFISAKGQA
jgi:NADH dehydrogenase (ubiquinone) 1 alpha/beta subcomplex 1, acyl-carrier protein